MSQQKPIAEVLQDKKISGKRKVQIKQVQAIRAFAHSKLKLPKNNSYTRYVNLKRKAISWNLIATPKYSISPIKKCLPFAGCLSYLLYFSHEQAEFEANKHKKLGHDAYIIASPAYSTRGWFDDPIVSTMFNGDTSSIAQLVFHELAHQKLYRKNDSAFNEAIASTIGEQGTRLWLKEQYPEKLKPYTDFLQKKWQFFNLLLSTQKKLKVFYKKNNTDAEKAKIKARIMKNLKQQYKQLKKSWGGDSRFDRWFNDQSLNNAKLAVIGVYYQQVPAFNSKLKAFNYDFDKFYRFYSLRKDQK